jgi:hypothetical protein
MVGDNRRSNLLCHSLRAVSGRINPVLPLERERAYTRPYNRAVNCRYCSDIDIHILWLQRFQKGFAINTNILFDNCGGFRCGILYLQFINTSIQLDFQNIH